MTDSTLKRIHCKVIRLNNGWATDQVVEVGTNGLITGIKAVNGAPVDRILEGPVLAGMPNLHSHAHQRVLAGLTEVHMPGQDHFWGWRELMYRVNARITPDHLEAIATQLYIELLQQGYTSVAEFHYLHHDSRGHHYENIAEMSQRLCAAAQKAGINLTLLPVLYNRGGFDGQPLEGNQRRFCNTLEQYLHLVEVIKETLLDTSSNRLGLAVHSLRAVSAKELRELSAIAEKYYPQAPFHLHVAEQTAEVEQCLAAYHARPVEWLCGEHDLGPRWCLIHATHMTAAEIRAVAHSQAIVGLCPTTEANLGDGLFPLPAFLNGGGSFGIGSDSQVCASPARELQLLEYGQRLAERRRAVVVDEPERHVGAALFDRAIRGGSRACGQQCHGISVGAAADLIELDPQDLTLASRSPDHALDSWIFASTQSCIRTVITSGRQVVTDGRHDLQEAAADRFRGVLQELDPAGQI